VIAGNTPFAERYAYDPHGNLLSLPHLGGAHPAPNLHWDHRDQLRQADLPGEGTIYGSSDYLGGWLKNADSLVSTGFVVISHESQEMTENVRGAIVLVDGPDWL
jgi:hypothetical protein